MQEMRLSDEEIRAAAAELVRGADPNVAARTLGVSRDTALSLAAGAFVRRATFALVREHLARSQGDH